MFPRTNVPPDKCSPGQMFPRTNVPPDKNARTCVTRTYFPRTSGVAPFCTPPPSAQSETGNSALSFLEKLFLLQADSKARQPGVGRLELDMYCKVMIPIISDNAACSSCPHKMIYLTFSQVWLFLAVLPPTPLIPAPEADSSHQTLRHPGTCWMLGGVQSLFSSLAAIIPPLGPPQVTTHSGAAS